MQLSMMPGSGGVAPDSEDQSLPSPHQAPQVGAPTGLNPPRVGGNHGIGLVQTAVQSIRQLTNGIGSGPQENEQVTHFGRTKGPTQK